MDMFLRPVSRIQKNKNLVVTEPFIFKVKSLTMPPIRIVFKQGRYIQKNVTLIGLKLWQNERYGSY